METLDGLGFEDITKGDVETLTEIMKRAFDEDARRHLSVESGGPPGYDNGSFIRKWYFHDEVRAFKVTKDGVVIGGVAVFIHENGENYLGNMFIDPLCQDQGLGTIVWRYIENKYSRTKIWRTDTPGFSKRNHYFYVNKCGFKIIRIENPGDNDESFIMEKVM